MLNSSRSILSLRPLQSLACRRKSTNAYSSEWVHPKLQQDIKQFLTLNPSPASICLIGDPHLRRTNEWVLDLQDDFVKATKFRLHLALEKFRHSNGFGRGISACQIGINLRMIALNLGYGPLTLINPNLTWSSNETMTMWDDCMSIPNIMVKKQRAKSISINYIDDQGNEQKWENLDPSVSELLQHELDHLEGILNIDQPYRDSENKSNENVINMEEYRRRQHHFDQQVDYKIVPTV